MFGSAKEVSPFSYVVSSFSGASPVVSTSGDMRSCSFDVCMEDAQSVCSEMSSKDVSTVATSLAVGISVLLFSPKIEVSTLLSMRSVAFDPIWLVSVDT
ncbi:hypothetical protein RHMOL_Rhmol08G0060100 [Rhododendron molle]|uniref:Uncharacterized protein n=1 Tax=Rhododendron molle TaxID=49168 RepID=A0ACC0MKC1_RHOML|nr:hypothetical protein RHMOL_Rhmol08G0060100 [Rhododendron molle]